MTISSLTNLTAVSMNRDLKTPISAPETYRQWFIFSPGPYLSSEERTRTKGSGEGEDREGGKKVKGPKGSSNNLK